jgi:hypothetical protein
VRTKVRRLGLKSSQVRSADFSPQIRTKVLTTNLVSAAMLIYPRFSDVFKSEAEPLRIGSKAYPRNQLKI